jgi:hypothetical protein
VKVSRDRFPHQLPTALRQWPYAASAQIPQAFVSVARIKKDDAVAYGSVVKNGARMFRDKLKERLPPGSIRLIKHLFAKLLKFFNADGSNRFRDGFPPLVIDSFNALEFFKWHGTPLFDGFQ